MDDMVRRGERDGIEKVWGFLEGRGWHGNGGSDPDHCVKIGTIRYTVFYEENYRTV